MVCSDLETIIKLFRTDASGTLKLNEMEEDANAPTSGISSASHSLGINGVELYRCSILGESGCYNFDEAVPQLVTLPDVSLMGAYYAGNTLRYFKQNVGYFDIRLDTGEEVFLTETRLQNSIAAVLLPNLIIESTLLSSLSIKTRIPGMEHFMEVFDGQQWHSVKLPEDIHYASMGTFFYLFGVTSDAIWLTQLQSETVRVNGTDQQYWDSHLYRIDLDADEWTLEYCGTIQQPRLSD